MDTTESQHYVESVVPLVTQDTRDEADPVREFERFVQACFSSPATDDEFWAAIAKRVERDERTMDPVEVGRFEIAVDYFLSMHGLPAWTVVRQQRHLATQNAVSPRGQGTSSSGDGVPTDAMTLAGEQMQPCASRAIDHLPDLPRTTHPRATSRRREAATLSAPAS